MASLERPEARWVGDLYRVTWPVTGIQIDYDRFAYTQAGITVSAVFRRIEGGATFLLTRTRYNLETSDRIGPILQRLGGAASGKSHLAGTNWGTVMEVAGTLALDAFRTGTPAKRAHDIRRLPIPRYFLKPYVGRSRPTTVAAAGGTGKTWLAIAAAVTACQAKNIIGWKVGEPVKTMFLDWEGDEQVFDRRLMCVLQGHGIDESEIRDTLYYRNLKGVPLIEAASSLSREVDELGIGFISGDSLFYATGGLLSDAKAVGDCFTAAGRLKTVHQPSGLKVPVPFLFVTHLSKETMRDGRQEGKRTSPYGSAFIENASDYVFSLEQPTMNGGIDDDDSGQKYVLVTCEKVNNGKYTKQHAYEMNFTDDPADPDETWSVEYKPVDPVDVPEFADKLPMTARVLGVLRAGVPLAPAAMAVAMGMPQTEPDMDDDEIKTTLREQKAFQSKVRVAVQRLTQRGRLVKLPNGSYAPKSDRYRPSDFDGR